MYIFTPVIFLGVAFATNYVAIPITFFIVAILANIFAFVGLILEKYNMKIAGLQYIICGFFILISGYIIIGLIPAIFLFVAGLLAIINKTKMEQMKDDLLGRNKNKLFIIPILTFLILSIGGVSFLWVSVDPIFPESDDFHVEEIGGYSFNIPNNLKLVNDSNFYYDNQKENNYSKSFSKDGERYSDRICITVHKNEASNIEIFPKVEFSPEEDYSENITINGHPAYKFMISGSIGGYYAHYIIPLGDDIIEISVIAVFSFSEIALIEKILEPAML